MLGEHCCKAAAHGVIDPAGAPGSNRNVLGENAAGGRKSECGKKLRKAHV
jgi:hypothetical protein